MNRYLIYLLVFLVSCTAKKEAVKYEMLPDWVKQKPIISDYYVGVGSSKKIGTPAQNKQNARQDALADLASEVSIRVSSTSVLQTIETESGVVEEYKQRIEVSTSEYLEGFEPVDIYEDEDSYWIYFKVGQAEFHEKKMRKKQEVLSAAVLKYEAGQKELNENKPRESLTFFLQGLAAISNYLLEDTKTNYKGSPIDIGNELYASVDQVVSGLSLKSELNEITVKRGSSYNEDLLFNVGFNENPAQSIPVNFSFTGGHLKKDMDLSDANGFVELQTGNVTSGNQLEKISAVIDLKYIAQKAVDDLFIRGLITKRKMEPAIIDVNIEALSMALTFDEATCPILDCKRIQNVFEKNAIKEGYKQEDKSISDYVFEVKLNYTDGNSAGGLTSVFLNGKLTLFDQAKKTLWIKDIDAIKGVGHNKEEAKSKAYETFLNSFDKVYFQQGLDVIE